MAQMRYSFPFEHRGMLQGDRPAQAPSGNAIEVSGRRFDDLVVRTAQFARNVLFYGEDNTENGSWTEFFSLVYDGRYVRTDLIDGMIESSSVPPHLALLFAFFKMLLVAQDDLNKLTDRQLEFYFREVLGFRMKQSVEGGVTVFAELARNTQSVGIPKGQLFDAGKDEAGEAVTYESVDELLLGREEVALFAKYDDVSGFTAEGPEGTDRTHSLSIASKLFDVSGEAVRIRIGNDDAQIWLSYLFVQYTTADGWWSSEDFAYSAQDGLYIGGEMPPMAPYDPELHGEGLDTEYPVIRFVSKEGLGVIKAIHPEMVREVKVTLENGLPLRLENKYGPIENLPGVNPFGFDGRKGDWFDVILPFPATDLKVAPVEMNNKDVFGQDPIDADHARTDRVTFRITSDDCDQEQLSKNYSIKLLQLMKQEGVGKEEIEKELSGSLMAVSPRLTSPVTIESAVFTDEDSSLFLEHPCGLRKVTGQDWLTADFLLNTSDIESEPEEIPSALYLALADADRDSGQLSLHFRMDGSMKIPARMAWYYMGVVSEKPAWKKIGESNVLKDTTCGFTQDGTVVLDIKEMMQKGGLGFQEGYTWIQCVCSNGNCRSVTEVRSRAIDLAYSPSSKGAGPAGASLPAETISKTVGSIVGLKKVSQPFDGLMGTRAEEQALFRRRVAETLRHKGRAWSAWDYESLVLQQFPDVAYAKCLPSYYKGEITPGAVTMMVIPTVSEDDLVPDADVRLINRVREALGKVSSPFVRIDVVSPECKVVTVVADVYLRRGFNDVVKYEALVNDALRDYLRSWKGFEGRSYFREGGGVSDIIAFLDNLPYIDYVKDIKVYLDHADEPVDMNGSIELDSPIAVITSDTDHKVHCHTAN